MSLDVVNMPKSMRLSMLARSDASLKQWKYCWCTMQHMSVHICQGKLWLFVTATSRIIDLSQSLLLSFTRALHWHFPIFLCLPHAGLPEKKTGHRTIQVAGSSLLTCASGIIREASSQTQSIVLTSHIWPMFLDRPSHFTRTFSTQTTVMLACIRNIQRNGYHPGCKFSGRKLTSTCQRWGRNFTHQYDIKQFLIKEESLHCCINYLPVATVEDGITDWEDYYFDLMQKFISKV